MNARIVECVPNFSEGRDRHKLKQVTDAIEAVAGVRLLNVDPGADTNRTVVTFVGSPEGVAEAAFQAIARAAAVLDMATHHGAHPRLGATDVCPFVPVEGVTMQDCVRLAREVGERVGRELGIPVYLYEEAATRPERRNLAEIRKGEYEGLAQKLQNPEWQPDFGPARFDPKTGATIIGAREFLIAYNITLNSADKQHASDIAFELRERGRVARRGNTQPYYFRGRQLFYRESSYPCGNCDFVGSAYAETSTHCREAHGYDLDELLRLNSIEPPEVVGQKVHKPGRFRACKAIGWYVGEYHRAQISINLTNYRVTPPQAVLEEARRLAAERGLVVTGSEVVGLIPYQALLEAGRHSLRQQGKTCGVPVPDVLRAAAFSLGLNDVAPFEIEGKVLGLPNLGGGPLARLSVSDFADEVSRDTPAPGGGSIAAVAGALGAALASMVANLTHGKEGTEERDPELAHIAEGCQKLKDVLVAGIDEDTNAFTAYMEARRLPQGTPEEKAHREERMQEGLKIAVEVPWRTAETSFAAMQLARQVMDVGNPASLSDAAVGVVMGFAGVRGGIWNVLINLKDLSDAAHVGDMRRRSAELLAKARALLEEAGDLVDRRLAEAIDRPKKG
jgi:glutamate formiminotransferase/formiminotetrahydrofolate cyclodeaminase